MKYDISPLLNDWEFQPGKVMVRKFRGTDGVDKIQLRLDLGLLQMNVDGRPDGKRPHGYESLLEYYQVQKRRWQKSHSESGENEFILRGEDCAQLQLEAMQYHHRCLCLFQLEEFSEVIHDAERNLKIFDFVVQHAEMEEMAWALQQFRPQVIMMRTRAQSALALQANHFDAALNLLEAGLAELTSFFQRLDRPELVEQSDEIRILESCLSELRARRPLSRREQLEKALAEAVQREDYEKAAYFRDTLRKLKTPQGE